MFARSIVRYLTRRGRLRPFVAALVVALFVLPTAEALAFFAATGTGTATATATSQTSTVSITPGTPTYSGGGSLTLGGTATYTLTATCLTNCPAQVTTVSLGGWSSNKTGCDSTTLAGSFTMPSATENLSVGATATSLPTSVVITWVNLATTNQNACLGATLSFALTTP
jgi:hypothetical protein